MKPYTKLMGTRSVITNPTYLEAQAELGGKLVISSDETYATRRLQVVLKVWNISK